MTRCFLPSLIALLFFGSAHSAPKAKTPTWTDPEKAVVHPDFLTQGEYLGKRGERASWFQVATLDGGKFHVLEYRGGAPGKGWSGEAIEASLLDRAELDKLLKSVDGHRVAQKSATLGKKAPSNAIVFFDGKKTDKMKGVVENGVIWSGAETTVPIGDFHLHVEFRLPYKPGRNLSNQDRGNSGLYIFNNYEVAVPPILVA
ncbi:MAG: hypothetical protein AAGC68_02415, partial [Verrucomicrobiota bacterium]